jgi:lysophospholipase L1-like esterase
VSAPGSLIFDGNSQTASEPQFGGLGYVNQMRALLPSWNCVNTAVSGTTTQDMITRAPTTVDPLRFASQALQIVMVWEGTNDLKLGATVTDAYNHLVTYCTARRSLGFLVLIATLLPRGDAGAGFEANRSAVNALIVANWSTFADGLTDFAANTTIGQAGQHTNATYYADGVHLTAAGDTIVAGIAAPVVRSFLPSGIGVAMAAGPLFPHSAYPVTTGRVFPNYHVGAGANSKQDAGLGVEASLGADSIWRLRFQMPPTIPTGTLKLQCFLLANATSGVARINPKWVSVAAGVSPSGATPVAETVTPDSVTGAAASGDTVTFGASDNDQYIRVVWTLNATTLPLANETVVLDLTFETASWTLAQVLTVIPSLVWE